MQTDVLQAYEDAIHGLRNAIKELFSITQNARQRYDKAHRVLERLRKTYLLGLSELATEPASGCAERNRLRERYRESVIAYSDAVKTVPLPRSFVEKDAIENVERARAVCTYARNMLKNHEQEHQCGKREFSQTYYVASASGPE